MVVAPMIVTSWSSFSGMPGYGCSLPDPAIAARTVIAVELICHVRIVKQCITFGTRRPIRMDSDDR
jgi:hypothetical protein